MSQQLANFVAPITESFSTLQSQFAQLSTAIQVMNTQLQGQADILTASSGETHFQGLGAEAFSTAIEYYLSIARQHGLMLEQASGTIQTCGVQLLNAVDTTNASNPNAIIVNYVLNGITLDQVVEQGSSPVEAVLQEMRQTLNEMAKHAQNYGNDMAKAGQSFGQAFNDFFRGNFGAAGHDFQQSGSDFAQSWGDLGQFMLDTGELVWESVFEMTAAALIQCAEDIWQAVKNCASVLDNLVANAIQDLSKSEQQLMQFSEQEMEQIIKEQAPSLLEWFISLPWWAKILVVVLVAAGLAGLASLIYGGKFGGRTDQQKHIDKIRGELASQGVTVTNAQIEVLIKAGYLDEQIIAILKTADLNQSGKMYITDYAGRKVYGHTLSLHVNIDNTDLKNRARMRRDLATTFKNQTTAQNAVNYAIANSSALQDFIDHGAANSTASDTVCYNTNPLPNLGFGYRPVEPPPKVEKVGPLHCVHVVLAKTILGVIFILTTYPVPG